MNKFIVDEFLLMKFALKGQLNLSEIWNCVREKCAADLHEDRLSTNRMLTVTYELETRNFRSIFFAFAPKTFAKYKNSNRGTFSACTHEKQEINIKQTECVCDGDGRFNGY